jgi:hypothetical protein
MTIKEEFASSTSDKERLQLAIKHFGCESGTVHRISEDGASLIFSAASDGMPPVVLEKIQSIPVGKGMAGLCFERNEAIDTCNLQTDASGDYMVQSLSLSEIRMENQLELLVSVLQKIVHLHLRK